MPLPLHPPPPGKWWSVRGLGAGEGVANLGALWEKPSDVIVTRSGFLRGCGQDPHRDTSTRLTNLGRQRRTFKAVTPEPKHVYEECILNTSDGCILPERGSFSSHGDLLHCLPPLHPPSKEQNEETIRLDFRSKITSTSN